MGTSNECYYYNTGIKASMINLKLGWFAVGIIIFKIEMILGSDAYVQY